MRPEPPEVRRALQQYYRKVERDLRRDRRKLFQALEEFANMRDDKEGWAQFRKRWPAFFPKDEYDRVAANSKPSISDYPYWLNQIWRGGEDTPYLQIMFGIESAPEGYEGMTPEESWAIGLASIPPREFSLDWRAGTIRYQGACDFQRALYLLFHESWRAKFCEKCDAKFIAKREAQKYCSTDCSETVQRELKRDWWREHGKQWREKRGKLGGKSEKDTQVVKHTTKRSRPAGRLGGNR